MDYVYEDFRNALVILRSRPAWIDLEGSIRGITPERIVGKQRDLLTSRGTAPAGGQTAINALFEDELDIEDGWVQQPPLFRQRELRKWKMDFLRERVGVEVSFNHAEAISWQFTRLNIAGESVRVREESRIDVGVVICATHGLKRWARMDSAVGTFDAFKAWLREMRPILPIPMLLVGLDSETWPQTDVFRGTRAGRATRQAQLELIEG
jgi:hypothetical protein